MRICDWETLSERERQVAHLVAQGLSNKEISAELSIFERTVKFHRASVCQKLGVSGAAQLVARLLEFKEIPQDSPAFMQGRNAALKPRSYFFWEAGNK